ncbi:unnamed protein product, partial [Prorocentrum cordatum]
VSVAWYQIVLWSCSKSQKIRDFIGQRSYLVGSRPLGAAALWAVAAACRGAWAAAPALASPLPAAVCHSARTPGADGPAGPLGCRAATGPQAEKLLAEAEEMTDWIDQETAKHATGIVCDWPTNTVSDYNETHADDDRLTQACQLYGLRQLLGMGVSTFRHHGDVITHKGACLEHIAASANTFGLGCHERRNTPRAKGGIDKAFLVETFADSLAEALAEPIHVQIRTMPWVASEPGARSRAPGRPWKQRDRLPDANARPTLAHSTACDHPDIEHLAADTDSLTHYGAILRSGIGQYLVVNRNGVEHRVPIQQHFNEQRRVVTTAYDHWDFEHRVVDHDGVARDAAVQNYGFLQHLVAHHAVVEHHITIQHYRDDQHLAVIRDGGDHRIAGTRPGIALHPVAHHGSVTTEQHHLDNYDVDKHQPPRCPPAAWPARAAGWCWMASGTLGPLQDLPMVVASAFHVHSGRASDVVDGPDDSALPSATFSPDRIHFFANSYSPDGNHVFANIVETSDTPCMRMVILMEPSLHASCRIFGISRDSAVLDAEPGIATSWTSSPPPEHSDIALSDASLIASLTFGSYFGGVDGSHDCKMPSLWCVFNRRGSFTVEVQSRMLTLEIHILHGIVTSWAHVAAIQHRTFGIELEAFRLTTLSLVIHSHGAVGGFYDSAPLSGTVGLDGNNFFANIFGFSGTHLLALSAETADALDMRMALPMEPPSHASCRNAGLVMESSVAHFEHFGVWKMMFETFGLALDRPEGVEVGAGRPVDRDAFAHTAAAGGQHHPDVYDLDQRRNRDHHNAHQQRHLKQHDENQQLLGGAWQGSSELYAKVWSAGLSQLGCSGYRRPLLTSIVPIPGSMLPCAVMVMHWKVAVLAASAAAAVLEMLEL